MPTPPANDGRKTVGRYVLAARLGAGAFGTVYKAYDPELKRQVALKVPNPGVLANATKAERFLREAQAAAGLRHPNIVPVYDAGKDGDRYFIASAFIEGQALSDAIPEGGMEAGRAADVVRQLAGAVAYAHKNGIVHRDIKPANVLLDADGVPHLADFGLAARASGDASKLTNDGAVLGTPSYMAPEQAAGQRGEANPASDQYALGVVLYELLTGRTPFEGPPASVIYSAIHAAAPPPRSVRPDIPPELEQICLKALAKKPTERFADCQTLADKLEKWQRDRTIVATAPPRSRRHLVAIVGGVSILGFTVMVVIQGNRPVSTHNVKQEQTSAATNKISGALPKLVLQRPVVSRVAELANEADSAKIEGDILIMDQGHIYFGDKTWTDYSFSIDVKFSPSKQDFAILFRCDRARTGYRYSHEMDMKLKGINRFMINNSLEVRELLDTQFANVILQPNLWHRIEITAIRNHFCYNKLSNNSKVVMMDNKEDTWSRGRVGISVYGLVGGAVTQFRNPKVVDLDGTVLWEGQPELPRAP